jgi:hypothetical protein
MQFLDEASYPLSYLNSEISEKWQDERWESYEHVNMCSIKATIDSRRVEVEENGFDVDIDTLYIHHLSHSDAADLAHMLSDRRCSGELGSTTLVSRRYF